MEEIKINQKRGRISFQPLMLFRFHGNLIIFLALPSKYCYGKEKSKCRERCRSSNNRATARFLRKRFTLGCTTDLAGLRTRTRVLVIHPIAIGVLHCLNLGRLNKNLLAGRAMRSLGTTDSRAGRSYGGIGHDGMVVIALRNRNDLRHDHGTTYRALLALGKSVSPAGAGGGGSLLL